MKFRWGQKQGLNWRASAARQFVMCCVLLLSFSQFASASHAHEDAHQHQYEHEHEEPSHQICNVCILAVNDDVDPEEPIEDDLTDNDHGGAWFFATRYAISEYVTAPSFTLQFHVPGPPKPAILRQRAARAPPTQL